VHEAGVGLAFVFVGELSAVVVTIAAFVCPLSDVLFVLFFFVFFEKSVFVLHVVMAILGRGIRMSNHFVVKKFGIGCTAFFLAIRWVGTEGLAFQGHCMG